MSRRREDLVMKSSSMKSREGRVELGRAPYLYDARDEQWVHSGRSLSPRHTIEGMRSTARDMRHNSPEWMECQLPVGHGPGGRVQSRSPPTQRVHKQPHVSGRVLDMSPPPMELHRKYERPEYLDYTDYETNTRLKRLHDYDDHTHPSKEGYMERKSVAAGDCGTLVEDSMPTEEDAVRKMVRLPPDSGFTSDYREIRRGFSTMDAWRFGDEYEDVIPSKKLLLEGYQKGGEKYAYHARDVPYPLSPTSQFKDSGNKHPIKGNPSTSSGVIMRGEFSGSLSDVSASPNDGYRGRGKVTGFLGCNEYGKKPCMDSRSDCEAHMDINCHQCDIYHNEGADCEDYLYSNLKVTGNNSNHGYINHDGLYEKRPSYNREDHDHRDLTRATIVDPRIERIPAAEGSHRILRNSGMMEAYITPREKALGYGEMRGTLDRSREDGDYVDSNYTPVELARIGELREHQMPNSQLAYGYGRYAKTGSEVERVESLPEFTDDEEMRRLVVRPERMVSDGQIASTRVFKRKVSMEERIGTRVNGRNVVSNEWDKQSGTRGFDKSGREWIRKKSSGLYSKVPSGCESNRYYLEAEKMFDEIYCQDDPKKDTWCSYQDKVEYVRRHSKNSYESGGVYVKGYAKAESSKNYSRSDSINQRSDCYKQHRVWKRIGCGSHTDAVGQDGKLSEDLEGPLVHDPAEESEVFKQMVHMAFLSFSKKLNENRAARKLYKEQGEAGSLFCIVCGRKSSKEFLDTQRLVTHAYMSLKVGLRAEHLGLHKAICVLMGWNSVAAPDIVTWTPEVLPQAEAMAQKEDLILWPPVVIVHNISLSNNNHKEWTVISVEALGAFLSSKRFNRGKMRICLGNPGDQSVLVVKFLGTFSGLQEAERLHKYFIEKQHGRKEFEQVISTIDKNSNTVQKGTPADKGEECLLYGYMGISEDLDRVDFDTKKRCLVKSRKEIQDLADAPVKPE